jgi:hypothetical protein
MKSSRAAVLSIAMAIFAASLVLGAVLLPDRVASHFGLHGEANDWMSKRSELLFIAGMGFGLPLLIVGLSYVARFFPNDMFNLPHKEFWLAPERRKQSVEYLFNHSIWAATAAQCLLTWVNVLTIFANRQAVPSLPMTAFLAGLAAFLASMAIWIWRLIKHYSSPTA